MEMSSNDSLKTTYNIADVLTKTGVNEGLNTIMGEEQLILTVSYSIIQTNRQLWEEQLDQSCSSSGNGSE